MECAGLWIERRNEPWGVTYALRGELDVLSAASAEVVLGADLDVDVGDVTLDLAALEFVDLRSLHVLEHLARELAVQGRRMQLARPSRVVERALDIAGSSLLATMASAVDTSRDPVDGDAARRGSGDRTERRVGAGAAPGAGAVADTSHGRM